MENYNSPPKADLPRAKKLKIVFIFLIVVLVFVFSFLIWARQTVPKVSALDNFAQCLADKGITMYGAEWCSHCQNEKNAFGDSFRFVPYVECPAEPKKCLDKKVDRYPTWIFPASLAGGPDDRRFTGEQGLEKLSAESGCALPPKNL